MPLRLAFIRPLAPSAAVRPPKGDVKKQQVILEREIAELELA